MNVVPIPSPERVQCVPVLGLAGMQMEYIFSLRLPPRTGLGTLLQSLQGELNTAYPLAGRCGARTGWEGGLSEMKVAF